MKKHIMLLCLLAVIGLVDSAGVAAKMVEEAQNDLASGGLVKASELLIRADTLLNQYSKTNLPAFSPETPLKNPEDPGKIRKATLEEIGQLEMAGMCEAVNVQGGVAALKKSGVLGSGEEE